MDELPALTPEETKALLARVEALETVAEAARNLMAIVGPYDGIPPWVGVKALALTAAIRALNDATIKAGRWPGLYQERGERWHR
jgi:hypothetical protein